MSKEEEIRRLSEQLLILLNTPDVTNNTPEPTPISQPINEIENEDVVEIIHKLERLNVDPVVVRKIMKRVDEVYGRAENYKYTTPLFEEYNKLSKNDDI